MLPMRRRQRVGALGKRRIEPASSNLREVFGFRLCSASPSMLVLELLHDWRHYPRYRVHAARLPVTKLAKATMAAPFNITNVADASATRDKIPRFIAPLNAKALRP